MNDCPLCAPQGETVLWQDRRCRVILVGDADHPAFCRVVLNQHVREMTDLSKNQRAHLMRVVYGVEQALRDLLKPHKVNLAALGNQVPHVHWHVIPRFEDDAHFPDPVWAARRRAGQPHPVDRERLVQTLIARLGGRVKRRI